MIATRLVTLSFPLVLATAVHGAEPEPLPELAPAQGPEVAPVVTPAPESAPTPETPKPEANPKLIIKPAPRPDCPPRFSISLGAGAGIPIGASADRVDAGLHAAVDFRWYPDPHWSLWAQTTLTLLSLVEGLAIEPGGGSSVTVFTVVAGAEWREPVATDLELVIALGLGIGGFGLKSTDEALGWAFDLTLGARYHLDPNLSVRLDFAPIAIIPLDAEQATGGHLSIVLRGEASF